MSKKRSSQTSKETSVTENTENQAGNQALPDVNAPGEQNGAEQQTTVDTAVASSEKPAEQTAAEDVKQDVDESAANETSATKAADASAGQEADAEVSELDQLLASASASENPVMAAMGRVFTSYVAKMGKSKATDVSEVMELNAQLWSVLRKAVNTGASFRDTMRFALNVFRLNPDGAFDLPMVLRGIDNTNSRLNAEHRAGYTGLVTIIETASRLANPSKVGNMVSLTAALKSEVFTAEARQRIIGFFSE